jgi:PIN domain nuclease of toxin-antitoxin system
LRLLLDTQVLLWAAEFDPGGGRRARLSPQAIALLTDIANDLYFSAAAVWEVAIKSALNRPDFSADPQRLRRRLRGEGYFELAITSEHGAAVAALPPIHRDPFDRILVAQAAVEGLTLLTADATIARYPGDILKV